MTSKNRLITYLTFLTIIFTQTNLQAQSNSTGKSDDNSYTITFRDKLPPIKTNGNNQVSVVRSDSVKLVHSTNNEYQMPKRLNINPSYSITVNKNDSIKIQPTHTILLIKTPEGSWTKIHTSNGKKDEN
ncbi:MAG: hypothetical protein HWD62_00870 [Cyclobacteriaceae bacterium]|nr:MAG: hypothetical protein HWD62_00870 [Cyclobacteriaceae bacterium]